MTKYRVEYMKDNIYEVVETFVVNEGELSQYIETESVFQGLMSDCESYIRLKEKGYM